MLSSEQPSSSDVHPKNLRPLSRIITTHDSSGKAVFSTKVSEALPVKLMADKAHFSLAYTSDHFPAQLSHDRDIDEYEKYLVEPPGITISTGNVCRIVDMPPYSRSPMHRTVSLDYGVVLEGQIELLLDSGETRLMQRGDVAIQRQTNHAWRNVTPDTIDQDGIKVGNWARMLYVLSPAEPIEVTGLGQLGEVVDGIGVRSST